MDSELQDALRRHDLWWSGSNDHQRHKDRQMFVEAARKYTNPDKKAAVNAFWAHAADLLRPTVSSTGIDRAVEHAVDAALGFEDE